MLSSKRPLVLCLSGHDPGGGAGVQADIETIAALGGHALTAITAHTVQDTRDVSRCIAADPVLLREQIDCVLSDSKIDAIKIGLLGDAGQIDLLLDIARRVRVPVVLDPVLRAGGGSALASAPLIERMRKELLQQVEVLTPNAAEAKRLVPEAASLEEAAAALLALGARHVLVTCGDEPGDPVVNHWFRADGAPRHFAWTRVPGTFHGAGCTLASAIAVLLARGLPVAQALEDAQAFTHRALERAHATGRGRAIPGRIAP